MLWVLLVLPAALIVVPRLARSRRGQDGPVPGWSVPLARLEMSPKGRRAAPSDLVDRSGPLGSPATLSRFGLSRLGLVVVSLVALAAILLLVAPHMRS